PPAMPSEASIRRKNRLWALTALLVLVAGLASWFYYSRAAQPRSAVPVELYPGTDGRSGSLALTPSRSEGQVPNNGANNPGAIAPAPQSRLADNRLAQPQLAVPSTAPDSVV